MSESQPESRVQFIELSDEESGQRLDNYLMRILGGVPKTRIYKAIRTGEVRVNKGRAKPERKLNTGDVIRIPPISVAHGKRGDVFQIAGRNESTAASFTTTAS